MHEKGERKGKMLPQGGGSGGWIVPSVATQSKSYGSLSNSPFMTSFYVYCYYPPSE